MKLLGFIPTFLEATLMQYWAHAKNLPIKPEMDLQNRNSCKVFFLRSHNLFDAFAV